MTLVEAAVELVLADLEYLYFEVPDRVGLLAFRLRPKTRKMMTPCNTFAIFRMICRGSGTETPSAEFNQATTSKAQVRPKATKSFKNMLILCDTIEWKNT